MHIACLHTADVHKATFDDLIKDRAPDVHVSHLVRADLLAQAQIGGLDVVAQGVFDAMGQLAAADVILCTCSTLGPLIDSLGNPKAIRIDRPMMETAATLGPKPLLAICLESTAAPSQALLMEYNAELSPTVLLCAGAWDHFIAGDTDAFAQTIQDAVRANADGHDCVILAQASMRVAAFGLQNLGIPVLSSPGMAADAAIAKVLA